MAADDMPADDTALIPDDDDEDNCLCGMDYREDEATSDEELPPATGGVETAAAAEQPEDEDAIDGCDVDFTLEPTNDQELPAATGGM
jgi:hypothetical protein